MKKSFGEKAFNVFNIILMIFISAIMLFPYLNQIAISFNDGMDTSFGGLTIFPRKFTLANYQAIFNNDSIVRATALTVSIVVIHTLISLAITVCAAYALNKKDLPFRKSLMMYFMLPVYISAGQIPTFILYRYLGLLDNPLVYFITGVFSFYNMTVIRSFMLGIPDALEESAKLDGANEITILARIILPLCKPVIATVGLWLMVGNWNEWGKTLLYITNRKYYTLQYVVMQIIKQSDITAELNAEVALMGGDVTTAKENITSQSVQSATIVFSTIPIIMVYPFLQKYFVKGVTIGAVKE